MICADCHRHARFILGETGACATHLAMLVQERFDMGYSVAAITSGGPKSRTPRVKRPPATLTQPGERRTTLFNFPPIP